LLGDAWRLLGEAGEMEMGEAGSVTEAEVVVVVVAGVLGFKGWFRVDL
jgi:hypothetical protein